MTRAATGDVVAIRPEPNIYTVLVIAAVLVQVLGLVIMFIRANQVGVNFFAQ
jgi:hypothetical protein